MRIKQLAATTGASSRFSSRDLGRELAVSK
jgi:hypothetical protein